MATIVPHRLKSRGGRADHTWVQGVSPKDAFATRRAPGATGRALSGVARVWLLSAGMMVLAVVVFLVEAQDIPPLDPPFRLPWWALTIGFFATETNPLRVRYRRQAQLVSLNELPLVLGLFYSTTPELLLGLLLGSAGALLRARRQSPQQLAFNISHYFLAGVLATMTFHEVVQADVTGPAVWSGAFLTTVVVTLMGHAAITLAILLSGNQPQVDRLRQVLSLGLTGSITVTALALVAVEVLWDDPRAALLLVVPSAIGFLAYRGWLEDHGRRESLDVVYESTRMLHRSPEVDSAVVGLLTQARGMFRAERAEITLYPADGDEGARTNLGPGTTVQAMVPVPLEASERAWAESLPAGTGILYPDDAGVDVVGTLLDRGLREAMVMAIRRDGRVVATVLVGNRVGESDHFDRSDLDLFEPFARNLGVVLETGTLEQSLQQLRDLEAQLRHSAYHDPLTSLANRSQFIERVELALDFSSAERHRMAVLFIGVDDFKVVNDALGHPVGDQLLVALAARIRHVLGPQDAVARLGGDEFGVLLDCPQPGVAEAVAEALLDAVRRPILLDGQELRVRASVGIALGESGRGADELLRNADVAMATAKAAGKDRIRLFSPDMHLAVVERHELVADLQRAVDGDQLDLHYQPVVEVSSGRIVAFEALVRWNHPVRGMVQPDEFIPVAEDTGLVLPMGRQLLEKACRQVKDWQDRFPEHRDLCVAVNVSARQLQHPAFVGETMQLIAESGVPASTLILEITETVLMADTEHHIAKLRQLKSLGLRLAMDDFGTGYSSLSFLSQLPVDILKIAKPFVEGLGRGNEKDEAFAMAIVRLGQTVGMSLIAEGVERLDQLEELRRLGCDMVQGWYFAKAADPASAERLLGDGHVAVGAGSTANIIPFPA